MDFYSSAKLAKQESDPKGIFTLFEFNHAKHVDLVIFHFFINIFFLPNLFLNLKQWKNQTSSQLLEEVQAVRFTFF